MTFSFKAQSTYDNSSNWSHTSLFISTIIRNSHWIFVVPYHFIRRWINATSIFQNTLYSDSMIHMFVFFLLSALLETVFTEKLRLDTITEYKIQRKKQIGLHQNEIWHLKIFYYSSDNIGKTPIQIQMFLYIAWDSP